MTRRIFSDAARNHFADTDAPIRAVDPLTGIELIYRFEEARGGVLTCYGGPLGRQRSISQAVDLDTLNAVATQFCDELAKAASAPCGDAMSPCATIFLPSRHPEA